MTETRARGRIAALAIAALLAGCNFSGGSGGDGDVGTPAPSYAVDVRTDSFGIPHIEADDYGSLGYGLGYAQARDNLCVLAEDFLTIEGRRAEFLGRDGSYSIRANGSTASNVNSDFFWSFVLTEDRIAALRGNSAPEAVAASRGFAAGYSRYVREIRDGRHPGRHAACRDADWVREIDETDMYRRYFRLGLLASSSVFPNEIATAAPPPTGDIFEPLPIDQILEALEPGDMPLGNLDIGSNMYGLGPEATQNGQSMLFGNPHFPWTGAERLYQMHLTLPGELDIFGAGLYGVPAVLIGFNEHFAWSHTVSTAYRFTFYELKLNPLDPTQYLFDGEFVDMESEEVAIRIREDDGSLTEAKRTLYRSRYGPMLELSVSGIPVLSWNGATAYTLRDANAENTRMVNQFFAWNRADSLDEFADLHAEILGIPWVNTIATGPGGSAYYGDVSVVPNVPDSKVLECATLLTPVFAVLMPGLPVLDGSRPECDWGTDPDAPAPGIFGPSNLPTLVRDDHVSNMNDSHWLTHPDEPLTGFAAIIGAEETERSLRTRLGLLHLQRRLDGSDGLPGTGFNLDNLQEIVLASHIYSGELARDAVVDTLCPLGTVLTTSGPVDVAEACGVLGNWDLATNLDSRGGHLWREFWTRASESLLPAGPGVPPLWLTPFSAADPVNTPRGLNELNPLVQAALGDAVTAVESAGFALDAPMGEVQHSGIHEDRIPIFGDLGNATGSFTVAGGAPLDASGYPVLQGNSYIQTVTWESGCSADCTPLAEGFVTYSQSTDPASPHYQDQTERYSAKQWVPYRFTDDQVAADPGLVVERFEN